MAALTFADRKKFETLPLEVQKVVKGLTPLQFNKLRASMSSFDHFDFVKLPLEIREMIYGYLILTSGVLYDWKGSYNERIAPYPILEVSKDISTEVQSVMYRNTIFRHAFEMKEYEAGTIGNHVFSTINNKYRFAFRMFRNIELTLTPLGWHIHQDEEEMDLPHLLRCLINILASRDNRLAMELKITFVPRAAVVTRPPTKGYFGIEYHKSCSHGVFEPCQRGLPGTAEEQQEELKAAWMRAHLLHLVTNSRTALAAKGLDFVTLKTNVDEAGHNVRVKRTNEFSVKFKNVNTGREGFIKCADQGRKLRVKSCALEDPIEEFV